MLVLKYHAEKCLFEIVISREIPPSLVMVSSDLPIVSPTTVTDV